jgi:hypothetical protein
MLTLTYNFVGSVVVKNADPSAFSTTTLPTKLYVSVSILYNNSAHQVICEGQHSLQQRCPQSYLWGSAFFTTTLPTKLYVSVSILYNKTAHQVICEGQHSLQQRCPQSYM